MKKNICKITKILIFIFTIFIFFIIQYKQISAVNMESSRFKIESANTSIASGEKSSTNYRLSDTLGQLAAGEFYSSGYIVKAGFQYLRSITPFKFTISNTNVNLGTLIPNNPSTASITLRIDFEGAGQYQVSVAENHPLKTLSGISIPDTTCDGGNETCSESIAKNWTNNFSYGFGYNMSGNDIPPDFDSPSKFRPFPDLSASENPVIIMSSQNVGKNRQATLTFKVNISPIQPAGTYQTVINFIATPSF